MKAEDLGLLPRLLERLHELQHLCKVAGLRTAFPQDCGLRASLKQWEKFYKGRKKLPDGRWVPVDPVKRTGIVTNAPPDKAPHCRHVDHDGSEGAAGFDLAVVVGERIPWNPTDFGYDQWTVLGHLGERAGLTWGGRFTTIADLDHFELPDFRELTFKDDPT